MIVQLGHASDHTSPAPFTNKVVLETLVHVEPLV